jgi:spoIIIJ-associated protein
VEWVETTAKTVEAAKEAALDQLGVDEQDAEFEVLAEPKSGLFGFTRGEARVRARVRPTRPRPKLERRDRRRRRAGRATDGQPAPAGTAEPAATSDRPRTDGRTTGDRRRSRRRGSSDGAPETRPPATTVSSGEEESDVSAELDPKDQAEIVVEFLDGLLGAFALDGSVTAGDIDDDTIEVRVEGHDLGLLIGPKGQTLQSVQELSRAAVQRRLAGGHETRIRVDVAGYRQRRREALERFAQQLAEEVQSSGVARALEPMTPPDRKIVHDAVNELSGVGTVSEGEEPYRRVVIVPKEPAEADADVDA